MIRRTSKPFIKGYRKGLEEARKILAEKLTPAKEMKFVCPNCGHDKLEGIVENSREYYNISFSKDGDPIFAKKPYEVDEGDSYYRCPKCYEEFNRDEIKFIVCGGVNINGVNIEYSAFTDAVGGSGIKGDEHKIVDALVKSGIFDECHNGSAIYSAIRDLVLYPSVEDYNEAADDDLTDADVDDGCDGFVRVPGYGIARIEH